MESEPDWGKTVLQRKVKDSDPHITLIELSDKYKVLNKFLRVENDCCKTLHAVYNTCKEMGLGSFFRDWDGTVFF